MGAATLRPMDEPPSDERLMLAYRDGDAAAFEALYQRHRTRLYRYLAHQCGDARAAHPTTFPSGFVPVPRG